MTASDNGLAAHLAQGLTTVCNAWAITRKDGVRYAFTDHDVDLAFEGLIFRADTGMSAAAISQSTGLAVDNTEAIGALSDAAIREDEIEQGRFDGAEVRSWLVNWADPGQRWEQFRGTIGELHRADGAFHAELRGLTEALNRPLGRVFQKPCTAVLGDRACGFDLGAPRFTVELPVVSVRDGRGFAWPEIGGFGKGWFTRGRLDVLDGPAAGLWGVIKHDRPAPEGRMITMWEPIRAEVSVGDRVRLTAGCDKRSETCKVKFDNLINFQGFPDLPGEDWVMAVPKSSGANTGGSRR